MDASSYPVASVDRCCMFLTICGMLFTTFDVGLDYCLGISYFAQGEYSYGWCTVGFVFIPALINLYISQRMYKQDLEMSADPVIQRRNQSKYSKLIQNKLYWPFIILIPLLSVFRCIDSLIYAQEARKCKKSGDRYNQSILYMKMQKENQDIAHLRVFECFLETAPQAILQLTILLQNYQQAFSHKQRLQVIGICTSSVTIGITMFNYNRVIRLVQEDKRDITVLGSLLQFFSHWLIAVSRFVSVAAVASVCLLYTSIFIVLHWIGMTIWIIIEHSKTTENFFRDRRRPPHTDLTSREKTLSRMLAAVYGVVYIFVYVNLSENLTRWRRLSYYVICLIENMIACVFWVHLATPDIMACWWYEFVIVLSIVPFLIGVISIIIYYHLKDMTKTESPTFMIQNNRTSDIPEDYAPINGQSKDFILTRLD